MSSKRSAWNQKHNVAMRDLKRLSGRPLEFVAWMARWNKVTRKVEYKTCFFLVGSGEGDNWKSPNEHTGLIYIYILRLVHDYLGGGGRFHTLVQHGRFMFHLLRGFATPDNAGRIVADVT